MQRLSLKIGTLLSFSVAEEVDQRSYGQQRSGTQACLRFVSGLGGFSRAVLQGVCFEFVCELGGLCLY